MMRPVKNLPAIYWVVIGACVLTASTSKAQITADSIAALCAKDGGGSKQRFLVYGGNLARTLANLSPQSLARVFGSEQLIILEEESSLNDTLELDNIEFPTLSSTLPPSAAEPLGELAEYLTSNPTAAIRIEGHSSVDFVGAQALSEARAQAALDYLINLGISPGRIEILGKGFTEPIEGADYMENQRIEFFLTGL